VFIGHELTPFTEPMLRDGTMTLTIDQNPEQQARFAVDVLMHHFGHAVLAGVAPPYRSDVPFTLYGPENLRRSDRG
jgi:LacI family transcriptional regulator